MKYILFILSFLISLNTLAQGGRNAKKKEPLTTLACPLADAAEVIEKGPFQYDKPELKIVLTSKTDSTVKAGINGTVTTIQREEDGKWLVVFYHNDYWFWYSGMSKIKVSKGQQVKTGDALGIIQPGDNIELLVYDFETPIDPKKYLDCKLTK